MAPSFLFPQVGIRSSWWERRVIIKRREITGKDIQRDLRILLVNARVPQTLDFASRGDGLSVYTITDQIELLRASGFDAPVRPGVYQWAGQSKAIAIMDLELDMAQSIITASEWLFALITAVDEMFYYRK